ncbi:hypothetical protein T492DRAFT_1020176 [Pavlovales sp. CCMP2436]|nr:hypothetical protein T492DRAFT_1020176 [Pavlovales sp. CCMP2436]|mmetsp:Transcript_12070/g.28166  ORF Transcript_12070/g.28166 Transcript_12070/m.28166 type:complete len:320 (+) Transcript_12070:3-962(+)
MGGDNATIATAYPSIATRLDAHWPDRRPGTATRKPFDHEEVVKAPWSYYEQWDDKKGTMYQPSGRGDYQRYHPQPKRGVPQFTVATNTGFGEEPKTISLHELRAKGLPYSVSQQHDPLRLRSTQSLAYSTPDLLRAKLEPRAGVLKDDDLAPGWSRTSAGLLPGKTGGRNAQFAADSTTSRADMRRYFPQPARVVPSFTLSWGQEAGKEGYSVQVPPSELNKTHFEIGREVLKYETASRAVHTRQQAGTGQQALKPFGAREEDGDKGTEYNIVHGGAPMAPSRYYEPSLPMQVRNSFRPDPIPTGGQRFNTITGELQRW